MTTALIGAQRVAHTAARLPSALLNRGVNLGRHPNRRARAQAHRFFTTGIPHRTPQPTPLKRHPLSWRKRLIENANAASLKPYQVMAGVALGGLGATLGGAL